MLNGNNITEYNTHTMRKVCRIALGAIAHASSINGEIGGDILYVPTTATALNEHTANVQAIIDARLKTKFTKVIGA